MGHRMEVYLEEKYADQVIAISKSFDVDASDWKVEPSDKKKVTVSSEQGYVY